MVAYGREDMPVRDMMVWLAYQELVGSRRWADSVSRRQSKVCVMCFVPALHQLRAGALPVGRVVFVQAHQVPHLRIRLAHQQKPQGGHALVLRMLLAHVTDRGKPTYQNKHTQEHF